MEAVLELGLLIVFLVFAGVFVTGYTLISNPSDKPESPSYRLAHRFDNVASALSGREMWRALTTPSEQYEAPAEVRFQQD